MMIQTEKRIGPFEYAYFFMIVIYSAMATDFTRSMLAYFHQPIGFLIPVVMTIILVLKNKISFNNNKLLTIFAALAVWTLLQYTKSSYYNNSYTFFLFYNVLIAYIIVTFYKFQMFILYEKIVVQLTAIAIIGWSMMILIPDVLGTIIDVLKLSGSENGILRGNIIVFSMTNVTAYPDKLWGLARNSGFSWEPGRYASMVIIAIFFNLARTHFRFKKNKEFWILLAGLITTQSTTGFVTLSIIVGLLLYNKNINSSILYLFLVIPLSFMIYNLPFVGEKIDTLMDVSSMEKVLSDLEIDEDGNYVPQRFDGLAFESMNIANDPILGYGNNPENSYVNRAVSESLILSNGLLKVFARFGLVLGAFFYFLLYKSSKMIINYYNLKGGIFYLLIFISISISYDFTLVPFFIASTLFGLFYEKKFQIKPQYDNALLNKNL